MEERRGKMTWEVNQSHIMTIQQGERTRETNSTLRNQERLLGGGEHYPEDVFQTGKEGKGSAGRGVARTKALSVFGVRTACDVRQALDLPPFHPLLPYLEAGSTGEDRNRSPRPPRAGCIGAAMAEPALGSSPPAAT